MYSPLWKITHQTPSVSCTPPFEKSPIKAHRFYVLPPLKNRPSKAIGFVYSPLGKITHQCPSVLCTPPFEKSPIKSPSVLCTPPFEKSPIKSHFSFCVLPPFEKSPIKSPSVLCTPPFEKSPIKSHRFVYSPLWKITVFGGRLFRSGRLFRQIRYTTINNKIISRISARLTGVIRSHPEMFSRPIVLAGLSALFAVAPVAGTKLE